MVAIRASLPSIDGDPDNSVVCIPRQPRLLERVREAIRVRHYSIRTEPAYIGWIRRFILFHGKRHPGEMGRAEVEAFLTHLAVSGNVAAPTQNQALSAVLFLYKEVLGQELAWMENVVRAKKPARLPVVFTREEVRAIMAHLNGVRWIMAMLLHGSGLRLLECLRLRVKDIDFDKRCVTVREGKGGKDRVTVLPDAVIEPLLRQIERVRAVHARDLAAGFGARRRLRHPDDPGAAWAFGCQHDDDLHTCHESRRTRRAQPCRSALSACCKPRGERLAAFPPPGAQIRAEAGGARRAVLGTKQS